MEFEMNSGYKIKKYFYNYNHPKELGEENLKRSFMNLAMRVMLNKEQKRVSEEFLNWDSMNEQ